jgi:hypothetical protein
MSKLSIVKEFWAFLKFRKKSLVDADYSYSLAVWYSVNLGRDIAISSVYLLAILI